MSKSESDLLAPSQPTLYRPGRGTAVLWIVMGLVGWCISFLLYLEYVGQLTGSDAIVTCNISVLITCGPNLLSPGGNLLGFSNSLIGVALFTGPIYAAISSRAAPGGMTAAFWRVYAVVVLGAFLFVHVLAYRSIFEYGSLCPWCLVVWLVTIPLFWSVLGWTFREGVWGTPLKRAGALVMGSLPVVVIANYLVIFVSAQLRLDVLGSL